MQDAILRSLTWTSCRRRLWGLISCPNKSIKKEKGPNSVFHNFVKILLGTQLRVFPKSGNSFGYNYQNSAWPLFLLLVQKWKVGRLFYKYDPDIDQHRICESQYHSVATGKETNSYHFQQSFKITSWIEAVSITPQNTCVTLFPCTVWVKYFFLRVTKTLSRSSLSLPESHFPSHPFIYSGFSFYNSYSCCASLSCQHLSSDSGLPHASRPGGPFYSVWQCGSSLVSRLGVLGTLHAKKWRLISSG